MNETYFEWDISPMGYREIDDLAKMLSAYADSPDGRDVTKIGFNANYGNVFLMDEDYRVWMMNGDSLDEWYNCGECGNEGFHEDICDIGNVCNQCGRDLITGEYPEDDIDDE